MNIQSNEKGISLIEVLIAMSITTLSILGLTRLQLENLTNSMDTDQNAQAIYLTDNIINSIHGNASNQAEFLTKTLFGNNDFHDCNDYRVKSNKYCHSYHDGITRRTALFCSPAELAAHSIFSSMCNQHNRDNNSIQGSHHSLVKPSIKIEDINHGELKITLQWQRRTLKGSPDQHDIGEYQINIIP